MDYFMQTREMARNSASFFGIGFERYFSAIRIHFPICWGVRKILEFRA